MRYVDLSADVCQGVYQRCATALTAVRHAAPVLLHGLDESCWPLLAHAGHRGLQTRIGMEDTLLLPDGSTAPGKAELVAAAVRLLSR